MTSTATVDLSLAVDAGTLRGSAVVQAGGSCDCLIRVPQGVTGPHGDGEVLTIPRGSVTKFSWTTALPTPTPCHLTGHDSVLPLVLLPSEVTVGIDAVGSAGDRILVHRASPVAITIVPASYGIRAEATGVRVWSDRGTEVGASRIARLVAEPLRMFNNLLRPPLPDVVDIVVADSVSCDATTSPTAIAFSRALAADERRLAGLFAAHEAAHLWIGAGAPITGDPDGVLREGLPEALQAIYHERCGRHRLAAQLRATAREAAEAVHTSHSRERYEPWWQAALWFDLELRIGTDELVRRIGAEYWTGCVDAAACCARLGLERRHA